MSAACLDTDRPQGRKSHVMFHQCSDGRQYVHCCRLEVLKSTNTGTREVSLTNFEITTATLSTGPE